MSGRWGRTCRQSRWRSSGTVSGSRSAARSGVGSSPDGDLAECGEVGVGEHDQRDVAVPAGPGADLVLVEADLALGRREAGVPGRPEAGPGWEAGLDRPARAGHLHEIGQRRAIGGVGQVEGELVGLSEAAPDQEAFLPAGRHGSGEG